MVECYYDVRGVGAVGGAGRGRRRGRRGDCGWGGWVSAWVGERKIHSMLTYFGEAVSILGLDILDARYTFEEEGGPSTSDSGGRDYDKAARQDRNITKQATTQTLDNACILRLHHDKSSTTKLRLHHVE